MMASNDAELLQRYARDRSESAFQELVQRHLDLVYSAALRQTRGDAPLAQEVAQVVFCDLARKASSLTTRASIAGWCYTSARFAAAKVVRAERRRKAREQEAASMHELHDTPESSPNVDQLRFVLDDAMHELAPVDREAVLLRYFQDRDLKAVGAALGLSDDAARKRVERALDKLRAILERRGITSTRSALASALASVAISSAPAGLGASVATAALASSAAATTGLASTLIHLMNATQIKTTVVGALALAGLTTALIIEHQSKNRLAEELTELRRPSAELETLRAENERLKKLEADSEELARLRKDQLELLRLRGETTTLRRRLAEAANSSPPAQPPERTSAELITPSPQVRVFGGETSAQIPHGQVLITGGWSLGDGRRLLALVTPQVVEADGRNPQIDIQATLIETPEDYLFGTDADSAGDPNQPRFTGLLHDSQAQEILAAFGSTQGFKIISSPRVTTADGRQARLSMGSEVMIDGEPVNIGPAIDLVPRITADGIDLDMKAEVSVLDDAGPFVPNAGAERHIPHQQE